MSAIPKQKTFIGTVVYLTQWIDQNAGSKHWATAHRALLHQSREAHEELEAHRKGYCVTCHRMHDDEED